MQFLGQYLYNFGFAKPWTYSGCLGSPVLFTSKQNKSFFNVSLNMLITSLDLEQEQA